MKHLKIIFILVTLFVLGESAYISSYNKDWRKLVGATLENLSHPEFYEALANPTISYINVPEGMRKEQIAEVADSRFAWSTTSVEDFLGYDDSRDAKFEGKYYPGIYLVPRNISGEDFKKVMNQRFLKEFNDIKSIDASTTDAQTSPDIDTILKIASIIEREAAGKNDGKLISGIIRNRLLKGMPLQMDATLQYAKGNEDNGWWPSVVPNDKKINSPYNTYKYDGLPPSPIANPGPDAILAAMNPEKTDCLYYFHKDGQIYCSKTYAEHVQKINMYLK